MTPQIQKAETIAVLIEQLIRLSASGPILVVVEDAQWMDPTTLELLDGMTEAAASAPVFIIVTHRPEFELPWRGRGHVTYLSLNRLGKRDLVSLVSSVAGGKQLSDELIDVIAEKTDGTPLFIEELTKSLMETGYVRDTESEHRIGDAVHTLSIPSTLQDALMARLDRARACQGNRSNWRSLGPGIQLRPAFTPFSAGQGIARSRTQPDWWRQSCSASEVLLSLPPIYSAML